MQACALLFYQRAQRAFAALWVLAAVLGAVQAGVVPAPFAYSLPAAVAPPAPFLAARAVVAPAPVVAPAVVAKVKAVDYADAYPQYQYAYNVQVTAS